MLSQVTVRLLEPAGAALIQLMEQDSFQKFPTELLLGVFFSTAKKNSLSKRQEDLLSTSKPGLCSLKASFG